MKTTLTDREVETLQLVAKGYSTRSIAAVQKVAYGTVGTRLKVIRDKLNAKGIQSAVILALKRKLIEFPPDSALQYYE